MIKNMPSKAYQNQKRSLKYSKKQVDRASRDIRHGCKGELREESIAVIQNFREIHLYPLMLIKNHVSQVAKKVSKKAIVARRLKRLATIIDKLERPTLDGKQKNTIKLTGMQDIGGCRVIVPTPQHLDDIYQRLAKSKSVHKIVKTDNYLTPKESGYGGVHVVYSCFAGAEERNEWSKTRIEVQLRTELQHSWATSLEIIDTLEGFKLKTSLSDHEEWRRFFQVAGLLVAHEEQTSVLASTDHLRLVEELISLEETLLVQRKLVHYQLAIEITTAKTQLPKRVSAHQGLYLVCLKKGAIEKHGNKVTLACEISTFGPKDTDRAFSELADNEANKEIMIAVLVSSTDVRSLKKAYPNYFGSTSQFTDFLDRQKDKLKGE